jgi:TRAP-type C4-dicarboxylate transport system permease small subunit
MNPFFLIKKALDKTLEFFTMLATVILVIDVTWQVATRFIIKHPSSWTEELATYLMIWVGLLGAAVALNRGAHLGVDYFVRKFDRKIQAVLDAFVYVCAAFFAVSVMIIGGIALVKDTLALGQLSPAMEIKLGYVYLAVPISGFFITLYSIEFFVERVVKCIKLFSGQSVPEADENLDQTIKKME